MFLRLGRTPKAELESMEIACRGDCLAIDIVSGSLTRFNYAWTQVNCHGYYCFTHVAIAVLLTYQSFSVVIFAIIGNITGYNTPKRILSDQGRNIKFLEFSDFCTFVVCNIYQYY